MTLHPPIVGLFTHSDSVTITIYDLSDNSVVVNAAACIEIGATGHFKYVPALAIDSKSYLFVMTNGTVAMDRIGELPPLHASDAKAWDGGALPTIPGAAPTASAIASQVRTELATELARIDAAISTRLAASGYTAPANADLTTLLARLTEARAGYLDLLNTYLDAKISDIATLGGATAEIYTVYESDGVTPMAGCLVWATSDAAGAHEIANRGITDDLGQHTFYFDLPAGTTVYIWKRKALKTFVNPDTEVV